MALNKTDQLNSLFKKWQKKVPENNVWDGIINEELFNRAKKKILFITKDPNNPKQEAGDFREWWKDEINYAFSLRLAEWSYGILNDFPLFDTIRNDRVTTHKALIQTAFMNIKKVGGTGQANYESILDHN